MILLISVYCAHQPFVEEDLVVFYDAHEHKIYGQATTIISKGTTKQEPEYTSFQPLFGWLSPDIIKMTLDNTTKYARIPKGKLLTPTFKSPRPALNFARRNEAVACDIVYSDMPAINACYVAAVFFVGIDSPAIYTYGIKTDKHYVNTLEDNIIDLGVPQKPIYYCAHVIISNTFVDILRSLCFQSWQRESYQKQHDPEELCYQTFVLVHLPRNDCSVCNVSASF
jgi:hypothetical protein